MFLLNNPSGEHSRATGRQRALIILVSALICVTNGNIDSSIDSPTHASVATLLENGAGEDERVDRQGICVHYDSALACIACSTGTNIRMTDCCLDVNAYETCENLLNRAESTGDGEGYQGNDWENNDEVDDNSEQGETQEDLEEAKRRSPFLGKRRSPFLGKRRAPFLGKRRSPFLGKRRSPFLGKRSGGTPFYNNYYEEKRGRSAFLGKRRSPFLGKRFVVYPNEF